MIKVKVIKTFNDKKDKVRREKNDVFNVTKERYEELRANNKGPFIDKIATEKGKTNAKSN